MTDHFASVDHIIPQQCGGLRGEREPADVRHDAADAQELPGLQVQQVSGVMSDHKEGRMTVPFYRVTGCIVAHEKNSVLALGSQ